MVTYPSCKEEWVYIIPFGVKVIEESAFSYTWYLRAVRIPESVRIICDSAFEECISLKVVEICEGVEKIGDSVFFC
ncbi:MAG: leucine-rich repeat protein, partial [Firmicutes bacterium]|nr:leucine-rich repeat protein [Bacillota bacterium]